MSPGRYVDISLDSLQSCTAAVHGAEQKLCLQRGCCSGLVVCPVVFSKTSQKIFFFFYLDSATQVILNREKSICYVLS